MNRYFLITIFTMLLVVPLRAQTVVKMELPQQPDIPVGATTLFDETLPSDMPTAIGIMGYDISGGYTPYTYQWLENQTVIANGETTLITPKAGKSYYLRVVDDNNCTVTIPIEVEEAKKGDPVGSSDLNLIMDTWLTQQTLTIRMKDDTMGRMGLRLYDMNGRMVMNNTVASSAELPVNLYPGIYLLHVNSAWFNGVIRHVVY